MTTKNKAVNSKMQRSLFDAEFRRGFEYSKQSLQRQAARFCMLEKRY
ncbi:MAG TPA: hypothetical protein VM821_08075 [Abditibacteriaceae bacterium]|nr:hypothetical protein [Abditibacteriaceae bacterium]